MDKDIVCYHVVRWIAILSVVQLYLGLAAAAKRDFGLPYPIGICLGLFLAITVGHEVYTITRRASRTT